MLENKGEREDEDAVKLLYEGFCMKVLMAAWNKGFYVFAASLVERKEGNCYWVEKTF